jgi:hypothetical protein
MSEQPHANHGHSPARWTATIISGVGFVIGGVAFPFHFWPAVYVGAALQVVALIAVASMNAAGYGVPDVWGELKAEAKAKSLASDGYAAELPAAPYTEAVAPVAASAAAPAAAPVSAPEAETAAEPEAEAQVKELSTQQG